MWRVIDTSRVDDSSLTSAEPTSLLGRVLERKNRRGARWQEPPLPFDGTVRFGPSTTTHIDDERNDR